MSENTGNGETSETHPDGAVTGTKPSKWKRWMKRFVWTAAILCGLWLAADFGYSTYVKSKLVKWESSVTRNAEGVREGCEAFSLGPKKSKVALLMVHGIGDSPHIYRKVASYLGDQGIHCRCMRLTGFGESVKSYQKAKIADWLNDVEGELKELKKDHDQVVVVAHSLGGAISIHYLANNPDKADGLVLAAPAIEVSSQRSPILKVRSWHKLLRTMLLFSRITYSPFGADALDENEKENKLRTPFAPISVIDQVFELVDRNEDAFENLKVPILLVLGDKDRVIENEAAKRFVERCSHAKVKMQVLERSAHAIPVDYQWKDFALSIRRFVKELESGKSK